MLKIKDNDRHKLFEENEQLKEWLKNRNKECNELEQENIKLKKNIDKATEYIKENICDIDFIKENYNIDRFNDFDISVNNIIDLLNILIGGDEE